MSTDIATRRQPAPPTLYRQRVQSIAMEALEARMSTEAGREVASRFALAFASAARTARKPEDYYSCDPGSVAAAVAMSLDTGLLPGGIMPCVWLIPRGGELQWMPSHRGLIKLAQEAGYQIRAVPVGPNDTLEIEDGEVARLVQDPDACPDSLDALRGVVVYVTRLSDGSRFGSVWVPGAAIKARSRVKGAGPVWREWPVEMAIKSAIKYVFARGYVPVESVALDAAMSADRVIEAEATVSRAPSAMPTAAPPAALSTSVPDPEPAAEPEPVAPPTEPVAPPTEPADADF